MDGLAWIPLVLAAAAVQTVRNAAQRSLVASAGTLPATFVRFVFGLPFALVALALAAWSSGTALPALQLAFLGWVTLGALTQLAATAFLIAAMEARSFVVAVAFSKTELLQVGLYSIVLLGEPLGATGAGAIALASVGVVLLSVQPAAERGALGRSWLSPAALLGLASGAGFALSAVGYRAAALALDHPLPWVSGTLALALAMALQTGVLGAYLAATDRRGLAVVRAHWRVSLLAGFAGALASMGWLTAFAMRSAVDVRVVGLVEVVYSYVLSRRVFAEPVSRREVWGIALVLAGIVVITLGR
jgi:drug/metabolite transporter (DMT)-like permease